MVDDARVRTRVFLTTYLSAAAITEDNGTTLAPYTICYENPPYPLKRIFYDKANDACITLGAPTSESEKTFDGSVKGYLEHVPITIYTIDTQTVTGEMLIWKIEAEIRRVVETYWTGSFRSIGGIKPNSHPFDGWTLYSKTYDLTYERDKT